MPYLACSQPYQVVYWGGVYCSGNIIPVSDLTNNNNLIFCDVPFIEYNQVVTCSGSPLFTDNILLASPSHNLFSVDGYSFINGYLEQPNSIQNILVSATTSTNSDPAVMSLSTAEYSTLIGFAITSMAIAFTLNMIFRQIVNRN